jgi:hypothetical protein
VRSFICSWCICNPSCESNPIHPLCVAGCAKDYVETLLNKSKGDIVIERDDTIWRKVKKSVGGRQVKYGFDGTIEGVSYHNIGMVLSFGIRSTC